MGIDTYKIKRPMGFLKHFATMWMRMWMLHSIARTMEDPSLERRLASIKCPTTMSLIDLMRCCNTVMEGDTPRRWGHIVTFMRFADRYLLTRQHVVFGDCKSSQHVCTGFVAAGCYVSLLLCEILVQIKKNVIKSATVCLL